MQPKRKPWLGLVGLVLTIGGFCSLVAFDGLAPPLLLMGLGLLVLIYALVTGNVKFWG